MITLENLYVPLRLGVLVSEDSESLGVRDMLLDLNCAKIESLPCFNGDHDVISNFIECFASLLQRFRLDMIFSWLLGQCLCSQYLYCSVARCRTQRFRALLFFLFFDLNLNIFPSSLKFPSLWLTLGLHALNLEVTLLVIIIIPISLSDLRVAFILFLFRMSHGADLTRE